MKEKEKLFTKWFGEEVLIFLNGFATFFLKYALDYFNSAF